MNNMKKIVVLACVCATALAAVARPHFGPPPPPRYHHHHHHHGAAVAAGILGARLLGAAGADADTRPDPAVVRPPVVVAPQPQVVVQTPPPVVATGHYETRVQNVWVEGRYIDQVAANGAVIRTWQPGHYEQQTTQVWVP